MRTKFFKVWDAENSAAGDLLSAAQAALSARGLRILSVGDRPAAAATITRLRNDGLLLNVSLLAGGEEEEEGVGGLMQRWLVVGGRRYCWRLLATTCHQHHHPERFNWEIEKVT